MPIYLDNSAATACCPEAAAAATDGMLNLFGNPSSLHDMGLDAERQLKASRAVIAGALACAPDEIIFTSGGSESNNLALTGAATPFRKGRIISSAAEHASVLEPLKRLEAMGFSLTLLSPGRDGTVSTQSLTETLTGDTVLLSFSLVNSETGAVNPISALSAAAKAAAPKSVFHCDAVQAFSKMPLNMNQLKLDLCTVSAHKIHGPKGVGALYARKGMRLSPLMYGGGQERGKRPGTENVPGIMGFSAAVTAADPDSDSKTVSVLKSALISGLAPLSAHINCDSGFPYIVNFSINGLLSQPLIQFLCDRDIYVSGGSACSRGKRSHVLTAMGLPPKVIDGAIRVSLSRYSTIDDINALLAALSAAKTAFKV